MNWNLTGPIVFTGQVGCDKRPFIEKVKQHLSEMSGAAIECVSTGDMMYAEDDSIPPGKILKLPEQRLRNIRRAIMRDVIDMANDGAPLLVNTHASFRAAHGLFPGYDLDQLEALSPAMVINVVDNIQAVRARLGDDDTIPNTLIDCLISREAELNCSKEMARFCSYNYKKSGSTKCCDFFVVARGPNDRRAEAVAKMILDRVRTRIYPSFPMTHVYELPDIMARINAFRDEMAKHFVTFDPADVDEKLLTNEAHKAQSAGQKSFAFKVLGNMVEFNTSEVLSVEAEIDRQICDRDFKLIEQSHMIVSLIPELPDLKPSISSGVERELHRSFETGKDVYVVWVPKRQPSPFITNHAKLVVSSEAELFEHFRKRGIMPAA